MLYRLCLDEFAVTIQCKELGQSLARGQLAEKKQYSCLKEHPCSTTTLAYRWPNVDTTVSVTLTANVAPT